MTSASGYHLLVVDDEPDLLTLYELTLLREGYHVDIAASVAEGWASLGRRHYDLLITDMRMPDGTGLELLQRLEQAGRSEKSIVITAHGSAENAVQALKAGAYDYLTKPVDLKQFRSVVSAALGRVVGSSDAVPVPGPDVSTAPSLQRMTGGSAAMQAVRERVAKVARSMAPVLVHGESGTGKELVARAVHQLSARASRPFVAVNCGAIPEQLLEAEFFGYRKGAFTGAHEDREGFFQAAAGGTLFLDEMGDLPLAMQSKLLRVIQERAVRPVGAVHETATDVRIVSATHKDLAEEVRAGRFRQDLYYRLNVIQIRVPPLRERLDDLPSLCERVLARIATEAGARPLRLSPDALARLFRHAFPGNVRELENLLQRAVALSAGPQIECEDLGLDDVPAEPWPQDSGPGVQARPSSAGGAPHGPSGSGPVGAGRVPDTDLPPNLEAHLDDIEREVLMRALERHRCNRTAAGAALGLSLRQMRYRMARLGIQLAGEAIVRDEAEGDRD